MRKLVYTCVTNDYDILEDPKVVSKDYDYVCFTDNPQKVSIWNQVPLLKTLSTPRLTSRYHKIAGSNLLQSRQYLWQDAKITLNCNPDILFNMTNLKPLCLIKHPARNCIYTEGSCTVKMGKSDPVVTENQLSYYRNNGYPENNGLYETAILIRENTEEIRQFNDLWWHEVETYTQRDQISLPYVLDKAQIPFSIMNLLYHKTDLFFLKDHVK